MKREETVAKRAFVMGIQSKGGLLVWSSGPLVLSGRAVGRRKERRERVEMDFLRQVITSSGALSSAYDYGRLILAFCWHERA